MGASWNVGISGRRRFVASMQVTVASLVPLLMLLSLPVQAESDRPLLATLLAEVRIAVPPKPFPAPSFSAPDLAGGTVDLNALRGRVVLLYFWTTW